MFDVTNNKFERSHLNINDTMKKKANSFYDGKLIIAQFSIKH